MTQASPTAHDRGAAGPTAPPGLRALYIVAGIICGLACLPPSRSRWRPAPEAIVWTVSKVSAAAAGTMFLYAMTRESFSPLQ